jgi:choline dehydrogenase
VGIQHKSDSKLEAADIHVNLFFANLQGMNDGWYVLYWHYYSTVFLNSRTSHVFYFKRVDTILDSAGIFTFNLITAPSGSRTGKVTLLSDDPFDVVDIDFNGYDDDDLTKSADAISWIRKLAKSLGPLFSHEIVPGSDVKSEEDIKAFVSRRGWGHHAIGTAKMGASSDPMAVVDGQFRVRGVQSLRVADASVLPNHPGFYVMIPLYMLAEKAADDIIKENFTINPASFSCTP